MSDAFHRLVAPSEWATGLEYLSFSSLHRIEECPRRWQLTRSSWPGFSSLPTRPHAAALEGTIVHDVLDLAFRAMAFEGLPTPESAAFRAVLRRVDVPREIQRRLDQAHAALAGHPRGASLRVPHDARALYNRVAKLFQREYATVDRSDASPVASLPASERSGRDGLALLRARGVLTEWSVAHPTLPVRGVIDLLRRGEDGTHIVDFKTGQVRPEYAEQLALYALLWWRATGDLPVSTTLRHPGGRTEHPVDAARLVALEDALAQRIAAVRAAVALVPAPARGGERCVRCDARPFCDDYWRALPGVPEQRAAGRRRGDVEVRVPDVIEPNGFVAQNSGRRLPVVWSDETARVHGPFVSGERLRVLEAELTEDEVRLTMYTEVFHHA